MILMTIGISSVLQTYCCYWQKQKRISVTGSCHKAILNKTIKPCTGKSQGIVPYLASGDPNKEWVLDTPEKVYQAL